MKTRKIILIAADVLLLAVCIFQWISAAKDNVKTFTFKEEPDELIIEKADGNFTLTKQGDSWVIGDKKYPANEGTVDSMVSSVEEIRALDKMGKVNNEVISARYDLTETKSIKVTVNAAGKTVRKITIGKESSVSVNGDAEIRPELVKKLVEKGFDLYEMAIQKNSLEDVFHTLTTASEAK